MTKKQSQTKKKPKKREKYVKTKITSRSHNYEIRSYFIDTIIDMSEYLKDREFNKLIRGKEGQQKEKIRTDRVKAIGNLCNIGLRALKDRQLDEYEKELIELKHGLMFDPESDDIIEVSPEKVQEIADMEFKFNKLKEEGVSDDGN